MDINVRLQNDAGEQSSSGVVVTFEDGETAEFSAFLLYTTLVFDHSLPEKVEEHDR